MILSVTTVWRSWLAFSSVLIVGVQAKSIVISQEDFLSTCKGCTYLAEEMINRDDIALRDKESAIAAFKFTYSSSRKRAGNNDLLEILDNQWKNVETKLQEHRSREEAAAREAQRRFSSGGGGGGGGGGRMGYYLMNPRWDHELGLSGGIIVDIPPGGWNELENPFLRTKSVRSELDGLRIRVGDY